MALRDDNVPAVTLFQVGHEGNPRYSDALTVSGTLDGDPVLKVGEVKVSNQVTRANWAPV